MRELPGVNELHKADTDYNRDVAIAIQLARQATTPRNLIDLLSKAKTIEDLYQSAEAKVLEQAKQLQGLNNTQDNITEPEEEEER